MGFFGFFIFLLIAFAIVYFSKGIIIVKQAEAVIIENLGCYNRVLKPGLNFINPIFEAPRAIDWKVQQKGFDGSTYSTILKKTRIDLRECVYDFPRQNVITKDNVSISINALLYFQIVDPKSAVYEIQNLPEAIEKLTQTNLRNLVGQLDLDESLVSRDKINQELRAILEDIRPDIDFEAETKLIDDGVLDSIDIIGIVTELNDNFDIEINVQDLLPENFNSMAAIWELVCKLKED